MTRIPPIIERAKQGDSHAIAALINRHLQVQGVTAKTKVKGDCLRLMLEGNAVPNQEVMVQFIYQGMTKLAAKSIKTVKIYGKQTHLDFPAWSQELDLEEQPNSKAQGKKVRVLKQMSRVLIAFLGLEISFNSLFVIYAAVWATSYYIYDLLDVADTTGILIYLIHSTVIFIDSFWNPLELISDWTYTLVFLLSLVWLHRVHGYLRTHLPDYSITPWGAVARFVIPFYSFWGIWNTLNTLAQRLKVQEAKLAHLGTSLSRWIPGLYITLFGSNILDRMYGYGFNNANQDYFFPWLFFAYASTTLCLSLVWLKIVRIISQVVDKTGNRQ